MSTLRELLDTRVRLDAEAHDEHGRSIDEWKAGYARALFDVEGVLAEASQRSETGTATEFMIRMFLWLGHGHQGQYGDDGEMQCGECARFGVIDYKREPLDKVVEAARLAALDNGQP